MQNNRLSCFLVFFTIIWATSHYHLNFNIIWNYKISPQKRIVSYLKKLYFLIHTLSLNWDEFRNEFLHFVLYWQPKVLEQNVCFFITFFITTKSRISKLTTFLCYYQNILLQISNECLHFVLYLNRHNQKFDCSMSVFCTSLTTTQPIILKLNMFLRVLSSQKDNGKISEMNVLTLVYIDKIRNQKLKSG